MRAAVVVFPGSNCDRDAESRPPGCLGFETRPRLAPRHGPGRVRPRRAAGRLQPRRLPAHRGHRGARAGHGRRPRGRPTRRPGAGHLQRLPGAARSRAAAGRHAAQRGRRLPLRVGPPPGRAPDTPFTSAAAAGTRAAHAHRPRRRQLPRASGPAGPARRRGPHRLPLLRRGSARVRPEANPNGSVAGIAGICGAQRNVVGLMPHPERASETDLGSEDGPSCGLLLGPWRHEPLVATAP